jgi:neurofibromin 1
LVAGTCFQHNPATQPQAFIVLGYLASDEADDDLIYQVLVAMAAVLDHFSEIDNILITAILKSLSRLIPGLLAESRYAGSLFWIGIGICQLGYIPLFGPALEMMLVALKSLVGTVRVEEGGLGECLISMRVGTEAEEKLDRVGAVSFKSDIGFSLVAVVFKGVRHPSTRHLAVDILQELLRLSRLGRQRDDARDKAVGVDSVGYFAALLPVLVGDGADVKESFDSVGVDIGDTDNLGVGVYDLLDVP